MGSHVEIADSLLALRSQLDAAYPVRSRKSDGFIASADHTKANPDSDHEPWWQYGNTWYVTAGDFTHDPGHGVSCHTLANQLRTSRDRRIKYVIWNHRIMSGFKGPSPWIWRPYSGPNPHTKHLHLSVVPEPQSLTSSRWSVGLAVVPPIAKDDELPSVPDVWGFKVHDLYTANPGDTMAAGVALEWAARHSAVAVDETRALRSEVAELRSLVRSLVNKLGAA